MKVKNFTTKVIFSVSPKTLYDALMDSRIHSAFTGSPAKIQNKVGGTFHIFDGGLQGFTVVLIPSKKIVQAWRCEMKAWPKDYYSSVDFSFRKSTKGTELTFTHYGIPEACFRMIKEGWEEYYWKRLKDFFKK